MSIMAKYVRAFLCDPQDEDVAKRNRAVTAIRSWIEGLAPPARVVDIASSLAEGIVGGSLPEEIVVVVERAIGDESEAFVRDGQDLQIKVCAVVAALELVRARPIAVDGWTASDAMAAGLWSALSFQPPVAEEPIELLRQDVLEASRLRVAEVAEAARVRSEVPEVGSLTIPESDVAGSRANQAYKKATAPIIKVLRENAELDREEIDFLWWALSDWSDALELPLSHFDGAARAIVAGIGGAAKLRKLPASGHRHVVLRAVASGDKKMLCEVTAELGSHGTKLVSPLAASWMSKAASVFPLLSALAGGAATIPGADIKRSAREWGARALLEAGILQVDARKGTTQ
jgi:hypothetical protein